MVFWATERMSGLLPLVLALGLTFARAASGDGSPLVGSRQGIDGVTHNSVLAVEVAPQNVADFLMACDQHYTQCSRFTGIAPPNNQTPFPKTIKEW